MKEKNRNERYAEYYFSMHGFEWKCLKQYMSKTVYELSKDGLTYKWELPFGVTDMKSYMELACRENHFLRLKIASLEDAKK